MAKKKNDIEIKDTSVPRHARYMMDNFPPRSKYKGMEIKDYVTDGKGGYMLLINTLEAYKCRDKVSTSKGSQKSN